MGILWQDFRYGLRMLRRNPGFTAVVVLTLGLGIGANTAIFSVVNAVVLRPLAYPQSERLVWLSERGREFPVMSISYPNFTDWRAQQRVFEELGIYNWTSYNLTGDGEPLRLEVSRITAGALAALRVQPARGRLIREDEDRAGAEPVALLSHRLWQNRFGSEPGILDRRITLDARSYAVIGVMGPDFAFPNRVDVWVPLGLSAGDQAYQERGNHPGLMGVGRLKPGITLDQARAELDAIAARLEEQYPDSNRHVRARVDPLIENRVGDTARAALWALLAAVGMVLLIACGNVANLLLARAAARQREMAVRAALGSGRLRIVRQLLTESLLLAVAGGALGLLLGDWGLRLLLALAGDSIPRAEEVALDPVVLCFTAGVTALTGVLFGLAPAWQGSRADVQEALKEAGRGMAGRRARLRHALVVSEVALTLMLLVGAGLLLRSFHRLRALDPGFSHQSVLSFRVQLPRRKYGTDEEQIAFFQALTGKLRALPGVQAVAFGSQVPLSPSGWQTGFTIEGRPEPAPGELPPVELTVASPDYFRVLGIPLLRGRHFTEEDDRRHLPPEPSALDPGRREAAAMNVVIVDDEFARRHWPDQDPLGRRIGLLNGAKLTVVGVARRVKLWHLDEQGGFVQAYIPALQLSARGRTFTMKTTLPPEALVAAVRREVSALDPDQPIHDASSMSERRDRSLAPHRLHLTLLSIFAAVALSLAVIGLYGVLAYAVTQRTFEIGIRMALGAERRDVLGLVIRQGMKLAAIGAALGLLGALGLTRWLAALLYEIKPTDPPTLLATALVLAAVALLASWLPARRAAGLDPMKALRHE